MPSEGPSVQIRCSVHPKKIQKQTKLPLFFWNGVYVILFFRFDFGFHYWWFILGIKMRWDVLKEVYCALIQFLSFFVIWDWGPQIAQEFILFSKHIFGCVRILWPYIFQRGGTWGRSHSSLELRVARWWRIKSTKNDSKKINKINLKRWQAKKTNHFAIDGRLQTAE